MPMMESAATVLPEPLSPTRQRVSPALTSKEMSLTANSRSPPAGRATVRFLTLANGFPTVRSV